MKTLASILSISLTVLSMIVNGQVTIFEKWYDKNARAELALDIIETHDGNFLVTGVTMANPLQIGSEDAWLIKINQNGDTLWTKIFSGIYSGCDFLNSITKKGNNYLLAGNTSVWTTWPAMSKNAWFLEIDINGNIVNEKKYGGNENDEATKILTLSNGGFIAVGSTKSYGTQDGKSDVWLIRLNNNLDTLWTKSYDLGYEDGGASIIPFQNDKYLIVANSCTNQCQQLFQEGNANILVVDTSGNHINTKTFNQGQKNIFTSIAATSDGGAIITGGTSMNEYFPNTNLWILKLDNNADTVWTKEFGADSTYDDGKKIFQQTDGNYIVGGFTQSFQTPQQNFDNPWVLKLNQQGDTLWSKTWGGPENDGITSIIPANDGSIIFAGYYDFVSWPLNAIPGNSNFYVVKLADTLLTSTSEINFKSVNVFPNPFQSTTTIRTEVTLKNADLTIYNIFGQEVKRIKNISGQTIILHRDNLSNGPYFIRLTQDNKIVMTNKILITN